MRTWLEAANTAALSSSRPVLPRSADFEKPRWASRSAAESFSETSATVRASAECARSPFSVLKAVESKEDALKRIMGAKQQAASAAGKSSWEKYSRALTATEREPAKRRFDERATGSERSRVVSHWAPTAALRADAATGCEPFLFLVGWVRPFSVGEIDQKSPTCHYPILLRKMRLALRDQIVTAACCDGPPNELAHRRTLRQDNARIDIRRIGFAPGNVRLINEQFQFAANFLVSEVMGN